MVQDSSPFFIQFNLSIPDIETKKVHRILGYCNPSLFGTLVSKVQVYIDGTFNIVPHSFYQCLIVMVYDVQTVGYVPVMYILITGKSESLYWHTLHWIIVVSAWKLDPFLVTCNFEVVLYSVVVGQFKSCKLNGSLFHWKQAICRKIFFFKSKKSRLL